MKLEQKAKTKESICMNKRGREKDHRRDGLPAEGYEGAGQGHISPDTASGGGSPRVSLRGLPKREREIYLILIRRQKGREVRKIKHTYIINEHV